MKALKTIALIIIIAALLYPFTTGLLFYAAWQLGIIG